MAQTPSTMVSLGTKAPAFSLRDVVSGRTVSLADFDGRPLLLMFICNHCPFVKHVQHELAAIGRDYAGRGLGIVAICSNDVEKYPDDSPTKMKELAQALGFPFPYLFDESQEVAKAYTAACTPDFFLYDAKHRLAYRGEFDDSRPTNGIPVSGRNLREAIDAVLAGRAPEGEQRPSIGCNIKWKAGSEPRYAVS